MTGAGSASDNDAVAEDEFDEIAYLRDHPDVAAAVAAGDFASGYEHYHLHGVREGRQARRIGDSQPVLATATAVETLQGLLDRVFARPAPPAVRTGGITGLPRPGCQLDDVDYGFVLQFAPDPDVVTTDGGPQPEAALAERLRTLSEALSDGRRPDAAELCDLGAGLAAAGLGPQSDALADALLEAACRASPAWPMPWRCRLRTLAGGSRREWRQELFQACHRLLGMDPEASPLAEMLLGLLMLELGQADAAVALFERLGAAHPGDPVASFGAALARVRRLGSIPLAHRGVAGEADRRAAARALEALGEPHRSHVAALLLRARFAQLCGEFDEAAALARRVVEDAPDNRSGQWLAATSAQYLGDLPTAEAGLVELSRGGCDAVLARHIGHLRHWSGATDRYVRYVDAPPTGAGQELPDARELARHRLLFLAVLADHDFALSLTLVPPADGPPAVLLRSTAEYAFRLEREADGTVRLRLGDGAGWSLPALRCPGPAAGSRSELALTVERQGTRVILSVTGGGSVAMPVPAHHVVPGDTLLVGDDPNPMLPLSFVPGGLLLEIQRYRPEAKPRSALHLYTAFYGRHFLDMLPATMFPSLMAPDNLPALATDHRIVHAIYCTHHEAPGLAGHLRTLADLGYGCRMDTALLDAHGHDPRRHLADTLVDAIERAIEDEALLVFAPPDHVFGGGLARVVRAMGPYDYVVCGHPRVTFETAFPTMRDLWGQTEVRRDGVSNDRLVRMAMESFPHAITRTGLRRAEPFWNAERLDDRYVARFREPPPLVVHPTRDLVNVILGDTYAPSFETIDHDLVDFVNRCGRLSMVRDSRQFFWMEYCSRQRNNPTVWNDYWSAAARECARTDLHWYLQAGNSGEGAGSA